LVVVGMIVYCIEYGVIDHLIGCFAAVE